MEIIEKQYLSVESLLSYRTRSTYSKLDKLIEHILESLKFLEMERTGNIIFSLKDSTGGDMGRKRGFYPDRKYILKANKKAAFWQLCISGAPKGI